MLVKSDSPLLLFGPGVQVAPTNLTITEGSTGSYTVNLNTAPTGSVTVSITASTRVSTNPRTLTFTTNNWSTNQTVTLRARYDPDTQDDSVILSYTVTDYGTVTAAQVTVMITDATVNLANVNNDPTLNSTDALLLYYVATLGQGAETSGLLSGLTGNLPVAQAVSNAITWQRRVKAGGDLNDDNQVDWQDALAMYYAYTFAHLLGNGQSGGHRQLRATLLSGLVGRLPNDEGGYKELLRRANRLRGEVHTP